MTTDALIIGPARIFVATAGTTVDDTDIAALKGSTPPAGWLYIGDTTTGTTMSDAPEYVRAMSQQRARALDVAVSSITTTVASTARHVTVSGLAAAIRGAASTESGVSTITPSGLGSTPKFAVALLGPFPGGDLLFTAPRCTYVGTRDLSIASDAYTEIPFEIEVLETSVEGFAGGYQIITVEPSTAPEPEPEPEPEV